MTGPPANTRCAALDRAGRADAAGLTYSAGTRTDRRPADCCMRIVIAAVGRLKQGPERELAARISQARRSSRTRVRPARHRDRRNPRKPRRRTPSGGGSRNRSRIANVIPERRRRRHPRRARRQPRQRGARRQLLREWRAEDRPAVCFIIGGADGLAPSLRDRAKLKLAFGPPPGRTSWCASCCWSRFIAPAPSSPATPITGPDWALIPLNRHRICDGRRRGPRLIPVLSCLLCLAFLRLWRLP